MHVLGATSGSNAKIAIEFGIRLFPLALNAFVIAWASETIGAYFGRTSLAAHRPTTSPQATRRLAISTTLIASILAVAGALILANVFETVRVAAKRGWKTRLACLMKVRNYGQAISMYVSDYDGTFPPGEAWGDGIHSYITPHETLRCPGLPEGEIGGYAFNQFLSLRKRNTIANPALCPTLYDSTARSPNASDPISSWVARHEGEGVVGFVDGHIQLSKTAPTNSQAP